MEIEKNKSGKIEENVDFTKVIVNKPWGYEYLMYENDNVSLWALHINPGQSTSLHCHSKKTTGLVVVKGKIQVNFLENSSLLSPMQKVMIRETLFHSEKCVGDDTAVIIELETPVDKDDLVRLTDMYGRESKRYERGEKYRDRKDEHVLLSEEVKNIDVKDIEDLFYLDDDDICLLVNGNFTNTVNGRELSVLTAGSCFYARIYKKIFSTIHSFNNAKVLVISKSKC